MCGGGGGWKILSNFFNEQNSAITEIVSVFSYIISITFWGANHFIAWLDRSPFLCNSFHRAPLPPARSGRSPCEMKLKNRDILLIVNKLQITTNSGTKQYSHRYLHCDDSFQLTASGLLIDYKTKYIKWNMYKYQSLKSNLK